MDINNEMKKYYHERAKEYDDWYLRNGSYDKGENLNQLWYSDLKILVEYAKNIKNHHILELAAGTGMWTQHLILNNSVLPTDSSSAMLDINKKRTGLDGMILDAFNIHSSSFSEYDSCFFGFWLSHITKELITPFFDGLIKCLSEKSRIIIFDSYFNKNELNCLNFENQIQQRVLKNGKVFNVYKKYYTKEELKEIGDIFFDSYKILNTPNYFYIFDGILKT